MSNPIQGTIGVDRTRRRGRSRCGRGVFRSAALLLLGLTSPGTMSCGKSEPDPSGPNVVLIVIDTLRPDHLSFHGYAKETAPFLARLAARGVVCERAHSTSS